MTSPFTLIRAAQETLGSVYRRMLAYHPDFLAQDREGVDKVRVCLAQASRLMRGESLAVAIADFPDFAVIARNTLEDAGRISLTAGMLAHELAMAYEAGQACPSTRAQGNGTEARQVRDTGSGGDPYTPRNEAGKGWVRVGRYDGSRRRALWSRVNLRDETAHFFTVNVLSIELCAGREGDDAYVVVLPENGAFDALLQCVLSAQDHIDDAPREETGDRKRIVDTDNHGGDYPDEKFLLWAMSGASAERVVEILNEDVGDDARRFYKVVDLDYELVPGFEP